VRYKLLLALLLLYKRQSSTLTNARQSPSMKFIIWDLSSLEFFILSRILRLLFNLQFSFHFTLHSQCDTHLSMTATTWIFKGRRNNARQRIREKYRLRRRKCIKVSKYTNCTLRLNPFDRYPSLHRYLAHFTLRTRYFFINGVSRKFIAG